MNVIEELFACGATLKKRAKMNPQRIMFIVVMLIAMLMSLNLGVLAFGGQQCSHKGDGDINCSDTMEELEKFSDAFADATEEGKW